MYYRVDKGRYHTYFAVHLLIRAIPDHTLLLELEPEELAAKLLFAGPGNSLHNFLLGLWEERRAVANEERASLP